MNNPLCESIVKPLLHLGSQSSGFGEQIESPISSSGARRPNRNERCRAFSPHPSQPPKERLADFCQTLFSLNELFISSKDAMTKFTCLLIILSWQSSGRAEKLRRYP